MALKENYKDDILDVSVNTKRKYRMTENQDGTVSLDDETVYTQQGDSFGASDMNATNSKVNALETDIGEINDNLSGFKFYPTGTGIVGLIADDSAYTDEDGNYVVWGTATANQLVEDNPNTYKSVPSEEDTRGQVGEDTAKEFGGSAVMKIKETCVYVQVSKSGSQQKEAIFLNPNALIGNKNIVVYNSPTYGVSGNGEYIQIVGGSGTQTFKALKKGKFRVYVIPTLSISNTSTTNGYPLTTTIDANVGDTIYSFAMADNSSFRCLITAE